MWPIEFAVNGAMVSVAAPEATPLLHVLREHLSLQGTRFGCGVEQCGCCMVLIDGTAEKSCAKPIWSVAGRAVTTIEGILIASSALLDRNLSPSRRDVAEALDGNICRCGSHNRIIRAVQRAAEMLWREAAT
jgi:aerobic-type carbon monoxide dehydrogenase small subunit (CoxS/CutS family)